MPGSAPYPSPAAGGETAHFGETRHRGVAGRGHRQRAVRRAVLDGASRGSPVEQAVDQAGGEAVAAADAVEDLQAGALGGLDEAASADQAIAPQSLTVALRTARSVVATTAKLRVLSDDRR